MKLDKTVREATKGTERFEGNMRGGSVLVRTSKKTKMTRDIVPEGFTLSLALIDALPVLFFCASMIVISRIFSSNLFLIGALLCFIAGTAKVLWKIIVVLKKKNIWVLFLEMRILMPIGFVMILISLIMKRSEISLTGMRTAFIDEIARKLHSTDIQSFALMISMYLSIGDELRV